MSCTPDNQFRNGLLAPHTQCRKAPGRSLVRLLPQKLPPELGMLLADENTDKEHDPYADIIGTC